MGASEHRRAICRKAQAKYRASGKHYEAVKRYVQTAKGKAARARSRAKQVRIGNRYVGYSDRADTINRHIKERVSAFQRLQSRTETKGGTAGTVPVEAGD